MRELIYWYVRRPLQKLPYKIAAMMPRWLVYHCAIRLAVNASGIKYPNQAVPELTVMDALKRWDEEKGVSEQDDELPGSLSLALHVQAGEWPHTIDPQVWAKKWLEILAEYPEIATDEGAMIGWFSNAIMAGYDRAMLRSNALSCAGAPGEQQPCN